MSQSSAVRFFLDASRFAVAGASRDRGKYGNKVLRVFLQNRLTAYPIHPREDKIEGQTVFPNLTALQDGTEAPVDRLAIITPPPVTESLIEEAVRCGFQAVWMQPGAESEQAIARATEAGLTVIAGGPCLLVQLGYHGSD
jgi:predicted CoA-binding protein